MLLVRINEGRMSTGREEELRGEGDKQIGASITHSPVILAAQRLKTASAPVVQVASALNSPARCSASHRSPLNHPHPAAALSQGISDTCHGQLR